MDSEPFRVPESLRSCVSRGGHGTLSQSICYGKPTILVPTPSHTEQFNNAKKAVDLGVAEIIQQKELSNDVLLEAVRKLLGNNFQERSEQLQKDMLKFDGLETAAKIIATTA